MECCLCCNILKGSFKIKKEDILKDFIKLFPNFNYLNLVSEAIEIRKFLGTQNDSISNESFIERCSIFFENIIDLFDINLNYNQINNAFEGLLINDSKLLYRNNVCAIIKNNENKFLIVKKNKGWGFPQGGTMLKDKDLLETIHRELFEETNISKENLSLFNISKHKNVYDWPTKLQKEKNYKGQNQTFYLFKLIKQQKILIDKTELSEFNWVSFKNLKSIIIREDLMESLFFILKEFPNFFK